MTSRRPIRHPVPTPRPDRHWRGLPAELRSSLPDVPTSSYAEAEIAIVETVMERGLAALTGDNGLGKTFCALSIAERLAVEAVYHEVSPTGGKTELMRLLAAVAADYDPRETSGELLERLRKACTEKPRLIVLDELDRWGSKGVDNIRYVWTDPACQTAFVFVGHKIDHLLGANPALDSRVERRVPFRPLEVEEGPAVMKAYHPIFAKAGEALLSRAYDMTGGKFREIAQLLNELIKQGSPTSPKLTAGELSAAWRATGRARRSDAG